ncbi:hypothetical protein U1Q18_040019 [Sarracenia purpurea var. burkii]
MGSPAASAKIWPPWIREILQSNVEHDVSKSDLSRDNRGSEQSEGSSSSNRDESLLCSVKPFLCFARLNRCTARHKVFAAQRKAWLYQTASAARHMVVLSKRGMCCSAGEYVAQHPIQFHRIGSVTRRESSRSVEGFSLLGVLLGDFQGVEHTG